MRAEVEAAVAAAEEEELQQREGLAGAVGWGTKCLTGDAVFEKGFARVPSAAIGSCEPIRQ